MNKARVVTCLNQILEHELAGVVRYTHYSLMVFGHNRIPIIGWLRGQATESLQHAVMAGEHVTNLGEHPSLNIADLLETHKHNLNDILQEGLEHEKIALSLYQKLLEEVSDHISLEEYAREMIRNEQAHIYEVEKMLRAPV